MDESKSESFEGWCIVEMLGHRRLGGYVRAQEIAGAGFLRVDVPGEGEEPAMTQYVPPGSIYRLTPTTEAMARAVAAANRPAPVQRWELPAPEGQTPRRRCRTCDDQPAADGTGLCEDCQRRLDENSDRPY